FVVPKRRGFDPVENRMEQEASRHADVYVFALLAHQTKATLDPLSLDQWKFYVLPTSILDARTRSQHSITLKNLEGLAGPPIDFDGLAAKVRAAAFGKIGLL